MNYMVQIFELMASKATSKIICYFLKNPTIEIYAKKLLKEIKIAKKSLLDSLAKLEREGYLISRQIGRTKLYSLNREDVRVKQLKVLSAVSELAPKLKEFKGKVEIYIYGSVARGEDTEASDIDILVIGRIEKEKLFRALKGIPPERLKIVIMTPLEYSRLSRTDRAFYERIEKDKIRLV